MEVNTTKEVEKFIKSLDKQTKMKIPRFLELLMKFEHQLGMPFSKRVLPKIYELRIRGKQETRLFYTFRDNKIIIFYGYVKDKNKIPIRVLNTLLQKFNRLDT